MEVKPMSGPFEPGTINTMTLPNRFIRSATWEGMAGDDGSMTAELIQTLVDLAKGGIGLIISGHIYILSVGQASPRQLGIYKDELVDGLTKMTDAVHGAGGKIVAQLAHAGHFALESAKGPAPHVVSNFDGLSKTTRYELSEFDISILVNAFAAAADRAKKAGFDGVQIHSAHGYLLSQFLSPAYNKRKDSYGGTLENRARIHLEIYQAIRRIVGPDYPVLIKINSEDCIENGLTREDSLKACKLLSKAGIDAIEISGGSQTSRDLSPVRTGITSREKEAYFKEHAGIVKKNTDAPIILVGGIRSIAVAEDIIKNETADYLAISRPLIREPGLINRWKSGDRKPATCKSDNLCFRPAMGGKGIYCVVEKKRQDSKKH